MADRLTCRFRFRACLAAGLMAGLAAAPASAQSPLADPTRPPAGYAQDGDAPAAAPSGPVLESVVLPKKGRPLAVIGGRLVRVGEYYGDSRLIRVTEREAVREGPAGIERLFLTPGIEKTPIVIRNRTQASGGTRSGSKP